MEWKDIMLKRIINTLKTFRAWNSNYSTRKFSINFPPLHFGGDKTVKIMIVSFTLCPGINFVSWILERSIIKSVSFSAFVGTEIKRSRFHASNEKNQPRGLICFKEKKLGKFPSAGTLFSAWTFIKKSLAELAAQIKEAELAEKMKLFCNNAAVDSKF